MMFGRIPVRFALALALVASVSVGAQAPVNIRLATLAPDNSPWTGALRSMGTAWEKIDRKARAADGLRRHDSERVVCDRAHGRGRPSGRDADGRGPGRNRRGVQHLRRPVLLRVRRRAGSRAAEADAAYPRAPARPGAITCINWGNAGWVQLFSKQPIRTLDDVKQRQALHDRRQPEDGAVVHGRTDFTQCRWRPAKFPSS